MKKYTLLYVELTRRVPTGMFISLNIHFADLLMSVRQRSSVIYQHLV